MTTRLLAFACLAFAWLVLCGQGPVRDEAPSIDTAEALLDSGAATDALEIYQKLAASAKGDDRLKVLYRVTELQGLSWNHQGAIKTLEAVAVPDDPLWRARFLMLKAELWRKSLFAPGFEGHHRMPRWITPGKQGGEEEGKALRAMTAVDESYEALRALRGDLIRAPLSAETFFVDLDDVDLKRYPTFWDFVVLRWTEFLLRERPRPMNWIREELPSAEELLSANLAAQVEALSKKPSARLAAALMADAAAGRALAHTEAAEHWQVRRIAEFAGYIRTSSGTGDKQGEAQAKERQEAVVKALADARAAFASASAKAEAGWQAS